MLLAAESVTPKVPIVDPSLAAEYWRNRAQVFVLKSQLTALETAESALVTKLLAGCGPDYQITDDNGLKCVLKPKPVEPAPSKK